MSSTSLKEGGRACNSDGSDEGDDDDEVVHIVST